MREIKFRAWDVEFSKMHYNVGLVGNSVIYEFFQEDGEHEFDLEYWGARDGVPIMQYTGLKDIDGEVIYEGDVWEKDENVRFVVEFQEERGGFYPFASGDGCGCCEYDVYESESGKIIGNIYENPELLEVEK